MADITEIRYIRHVQKMSKETLEYLYSLMPEDRKAKADRYARVRERNLAIVSYALLLALLCGEGHDAAGMSFSYTKEGKPYYESPLSPFNISHSYDAAACAVSSVNIGIDIQYYGDKKDYLRTKDLILTENEKVTLGESYDGRLLIKYWTLKECFGKMKGSGVYESEILKKDFSEYAEKEKFTLDGNSFASYDIDGYFLGACAESVTDFSVCEVDEGYILDVLRKGGS